MGTHHLEPPLPLDALPNNVLLNVLRDLEEEERLLSSRRRVVHERIDHIVASGAGEPVADAARLGDLQRQERELSAERLQLHLQIARFRIERGNRVRGLRAQLRAV